jgi:hypothetical protein
MGEGRCRKLAVSLQPGAQPLRLRSRQAPGFAQGRQEWLYHEKSSKKMCGGVVRVLRLGCILVGQTHSNQTLNKMNECAGGE